MNKKIFKYCKELKCIQIEKKTRTKNVRNQIKFFAKEHEQK